MSMLNAIAWIRDEADPNSRSWEEFYRNRWQHNKIVRSTHGVNCTGGCTWNIHVKEGIVTWEMQGLDYPEIDPKLERMLAFMSQVMVVEIFARETFEWGIALLSDPEVSANPKSAGEMVRFIQQDEKPHVEYLRAALSEVSARTLRTVDGKKIAGKTVIDEFLHRTLHAMALTRQQEQREDLRENLIQAMQVAQNPKSLLEEFDALDLAWEAPKETGFVATRSPVAA